MRRAGSRGAICCPYHSWCHATTGDLVATPHVGGPGQNTHDAIRRAELELIEIRTHVWRLTRPSCTPMRLATAPR